MQQKIVKENFAHDLPIDIQIKNLQVQIRNNPGKVEYRVHLAQLMMIRGQWQRSLHQLQTASQLNTNTVAMAQAYRSLIQAEIYRERVFNGSCEPKFIGDAQEWQTLLAESLVARANQQIDIAEKFQQLAYEKAPACKFTVGDTESDWIADGDSRLGPICEIFFNGNYYWLGFDQIKKLTIEAPKDLRDLVWIPTTVILTDSSHHIGFLPSRYVRSYESDNDQLSLSSLTEWSSLSEHCWAGMGQKIFVTNNAEYSLLAIRELTQAVHN